MVINLNYSEPLSISPGFKQDRLVVNFIDIQEYFISAEFLIDLSTTSRNLTHKIPRQMSEGIFADNLVLISESVEPAFKVFFVMTLLMNTIFQGILSKFMGAISPMQIITHLLMIRVIVPANVMIYMRALIPITQYDYLEPYWSDLVSNALGFDEESCSLEFFGASWRVTDQLFSLGYQSECSLLNLGTISFFLNIYAIKVIFFILVMIPLRHKYHQRYLAMKNNLFFKEFIMIITNS